MTVVLDASAVLALLLSEAGAAKVVAVLAGSKMSAVNYAEVFTHYAKLGSSQADIEDVVATLPITIVPLDRNQAAAAGMMRPLTIDAGLSLGDRCCLALAKSFGFPAYTADKQWKLVAAAVGVKVMLIR
jgi:ribonuclease VapC